ncbi:hypothetical protein XELAEV_18035580mg [Xenopus laevis]|uniref:Uncharacterized protein n=1 Tax=Xenopus laevis TaxID=8355 RepID=A0A974CFS4_XENLA|nr:hypothetical protein XELAEV_18035580mg [Xenopus laevis]
MSIANLRYFPSPFPLQPETRQRSGHPKPSTHNKLCNVPWDGCGKWGAWLYRGISCNLGTMEFIGRTQRNR